MSKVGEFLSANKSNIGAIGIGVVGIMIWFRPEWVEQIAPFYLWLQAWSKVQMRANAAKTDAKVDQVIVAAKKAEYAAAELAEAVETNKP